MKTTAKWHKLQFTVKEKKIQRFITCIESKHFAQAKVILNNAIIIQLLFFSSLLDNIVCQKSLFCFKAKDYKIKQIINSPIQLLLQRYRLLKEKRINVKYTIRRNTTSEDGIPGVSNMAASPTFRSNYEGKSLLNIYGKYN